MSGQPMMMGACCPSSDSSTTQLCLSEGHTVGIMGLNIVFERLLVLGRKPDQVTDKELVSMVRMQRNYIVPNPQVEANYAAALRREYASFCANKSK